MQPSLCAYSEKEEAVLVLAAKQNIYLKYMKYWYSRSTQFESSVYHGWLCMNVYYFSF